ncbi:MAG: hypothetical protein KME54_29030 [Tolypothrix brevis GSE-NOS-MK-07-07A]|nr:hypothetical protein [Tolypothrix brevis GSE-NOS-MK-07-07A]MBW4480774.1 hypothetical protein [Tolypothrix brevis GSE-NOS-MK-07-07A]
MRSHSLTNPTNAIAIPKTKRDHTLQKPKRDRCITLDMLKPESTSR